MMDHVRPLLLVCVIHFASSWILAADPPTFSALVPAGGQRGTSVSISLRGKPGATPVSVFLDDAVFTEHEFNEKFTELKLTIAAEAKPGLQWIRFYNADGATQELPFFVGTIPESTAQEPNDAVDKAEPIEMPRVINGVLEKSGDVDTFSVRLKKDETLIASIDSNVPFNTPLDAVVQILDERGFVIEQNDDDHGIDPLLAMVNLTQTGAQEGTFLVRVFGFPAAPNSTINYAGGADYNYRLTLTTGPFATHRLGPKLSGWNLEESDVDVPGLATLYQSQLEELGEFGSGVDDLSLTDRRWGVIREAGQVVVYKLEAEKKEVIRIRVLARALGSHLDPVLTLKSSDGKIVKQYDDKSRDDLDLDIDWTAPADGIYTLEIADRFQHFGPRNAYWLAIDPAQRATLSVEADHFTAARDKPLEIPVTVARSAGFAEELTLTTTGLPEDIMIEPVVSSGSGDTSKKVVLKLDCQSAHGFNGPFQIVVSSQAAAEPQYVTAKRASANQTTSTFWLTIPPQKVDETKTGEAGETPEP